MNELPRIADYSTEELARAEWPAIQRYLHLLKKTPQTPSDQLRLKRHDAWLRCALATHYDRATAKDICLWWSAQADMLIKDAWKLAGCDRFDISTLALGKLGSEELNLSSDVDLIFVRNDDAVVDMKCLRDFQTLLTETTEFGFCLRVDLGLRPGGRASTTLPTMSEFEFHYGSHGETWERLAYIRMRVLTGPAELETSLRTFVSKFVFRKHLDFTLLDDLKTLRSKIREEKFESRPGLFHLKLGQGGIRDLELFIHALQVIHGGRHPGLRSHSTSNAIQELSSRNLLPEADARFLDETYWYLRDLENRLHAYEDQQTYSVDLIKGHPALPFEFSEKLKTSCHHVHEISSTLLGTSSQGATSPGDSDQAAWLKGLGFSEGSSGVWQELQEATALSRKTERDEAARQEFLRNFAVRLSEIGLDRDLGLSLLLDFIRATRAKASFFTLLNREPKIRDNLATLFSVSPYLGSLLSSRPELIDEFILRRQAEPSPDFDILLEELAERRLLSELIAANQFLSDLNLDQMMANLTANADAICQILLDRLIEEYGPSQISLMPMGKWGGRELGVRSDLDFVFMTPGEPTSEDQKIAKRFLSRMTEPHRGGSIYAIDMRLRPSGSAGPILVSCAQLQTYLEKDAAAWERQAYLRSRPLQKLPFSPAEISARRGLSDHDRGELKTIRSQLFTDASHSPDLDLKLSYGGLADVEFTSQIALLARQDLPLDPSTFGMIQYLESVDAAWKTVGPELRRNYEELRRIEQLFQLTVSSSGSKMKTKSDEFKRLALILKTEPSELQKRIHSLFTANRDALNSVRAV